MPSSDNRNITIYDIAEEAGVSVATVSRVINESANVNNEKADKVKQLIEKYSFVPNNMARSLSNCSSNTIGILVPDIRNPYYANLLTCCEREAERQGYQLLLVNTLGEEGYTTAAMDSLVNKSVDGIIQLGGKIDRVNVSDEYVKYINKLSTKTPYISTGASCGKYSYVVRPDEYDGAKQITEYLVEKGHRNIVFLGGIEKVLSTNDKWRAFGDVLKENNISQDNSIVSCEYGVGCGYDEMNSYLDKKESCPTAVICINEMVAVGAVHAIRDKELRIPEDISLVAFDNTYLSTMFMPQLTAMGYDYEGYAEEIINKMVSLIKRQKYDTKMIKMKLVERKSVNECRN